MQPPLRLPLPPHNITPTLYSPFPSARVGSHAVAAFPVDKVVDTTGAGDLYAAGGQGAGRQPHMLAMDGGVAGQVVQRPAEGEGAKLDGDPEANHTLLVVDEAEELAELVVVVLD